MDYKNCPNCFAAQPLSARNCGMCYGDFEKKKRDWTKVNRYKKPALTATAVIPILTWLILPAPYNPGYQLKRNFYTPTAICRDGIYSFSSSRSGSCSNHGGVKKWIRNQD